MRPILLIESHQDTAELEFELLSAAGFAVQIVPDLDALDRAIDKLAPGLLLLSVGPRDRSQVGRTIGRANSRGVPVVVVTTLSLANGACRGAARVLTKPFEIDVLLDAVRSCYREQ